MYHKELQVAVEILRKAAQMARKIQGERSKPRAIRKADGSPVTIADLAVQALVCRALKAEFPEDAIVAEEDAVFLRCAEMNTVLAEVTGHLQPYIPDADPDTVCDWIDQGNSLPQDRFWVLDPVDGTRGFLRGDQYALALALIENGRIVFGALACPALTLQPSGQPGQVFYAVRGAGAFVISEETGLRQKLELPEQVELDRFRLLESVETDHNDRPRQEAVARALGMTLAPLRVDSQVKYALVVAGSGALYLRLPPAGTAYRHQKIWDHAAGVLIVEEAGGRVTDLYGSSLDFSVGVELAMNRGIVAAGKEIHSRAVHSLSTL